MHAALAAIGTNDAAVLTCVVTDLTQAETLGVHGSPTILIDGRDPFTAADSAPSISCRTRLTMLWLTDDDPADVWSEFSGVGDRVAATGLGRVELIAPFIPTLPGTGRYVDQLSG
ncbi:MAG: hypothetical protein JWM12_4145 [Ilumatobacteraceae bacterium]|nr:hypothetical protein [Ilumatobacteraceae bacterium]